MKDYFETDFWKDLDDNGYNVTIEMTEEDRKIDLEELKYEDWRIEND